MRIAVFSDIHGNAVGLDALLADLEGRHVDRLVCLGDTIQGGPQPRECLERLRTLECPVVMGNADWYVLTGDPGHEPETESQRTVREWTLSQLDADDVELVRSFAPTVELPGLLAFHGSPGSFEDVILPSTPEEEFRALLDGADAPVLTGGHTHLQFLRRRGESLFVNPGSVGLAYDYHQPDDAFRFDPWAQYAVVDVDSVEFRRVPFDPAAVVRAHEESGIPDHGRAVGWAG